MKFVAKKLQGIGGGRGSFGCQGIAALITCLAALALGAGSAEASPPSPRGTPLARVTLESPSSSGAVRNERETGRLDLRAPSDFGAARAASDVPTEPSASNSVPFPSARRGLKNENEPVEDQPPQESPSVGTAGLRNTGLAMKNTSRVEELTRRLHREGLPIARLWQTHSAMVSLGLSPRGKPGIWLIQKIP
jgi:hypothetical protein